MAAILTKDPAPLVRCASDVRDELQRIVRKAISKEKEGRYQTIKDLVIDLRELKQELEFEAKLERVTGRELREGATTNQGNSKGEHADGVTVRQQPFSTSFSLATHTTSSTRVLVGEIRRPGLGVSLTLAVLVIGAGAGAFIYFNGKPV